MASLLTTQAFLSRLFLVTISSIAIVPFSHAAENVGWKNHTIYEGHATSTAVATDFTGDGKPDVISSSAGKVRLFSAPDWKESIIYTFLSNRQNCIHNTILDVDGDGAPDHLGAYAKGAVFWLENPKQPKTEGWNYRIVDDAFNGIHCLLAGDVDLDGKDDLIVNNFDPCGAHADSILWFPIPKKPLNPSTSWQGYPFAMESAHGGSHYMGLGDIDGDGAIDLLASRGHGSGVLWFDRDGEDWTSHDIDPDIEGPIASSQPTSIETGTSMERPAPKTVAS